MSVPTAEQPPLSRRPETYAASLSAISLLGQASLRGVGVEQATELAYDDFTTKLGEMLKTDPELSEKLDVARVKSFAVTDGQARAVSGESMVEIVERGYRASSESSDERLRQTQAARDAGDVLIAKEADNLAVGQSMIVVSMDPKHELNGPDASFWRQRGYRDGIAYVQWYARVSETELCAAAYSIDHSDTRVMSELLRERGVDMPANVDPNTFIQNIWRFEADAAVADEAARQLRHESYQRVGAPAERVSVDEYLHSQESFLMDMFDLYYPAVGVALVSGKNQEVLREFATQALAGLRPGKIAPEVMQQIIRIANSSAFTPDMARAMDELIPYAVVEQLRRGLGAASSHTTELSEVQAYAAAPPQELVRLQQQNFHAIALSGLQAGLTAGRSYGGCSGVNLANDQANSPDALSPQDIYGGAEGGTSYPPGEDKYGALTFKCTEGHTNTRSPGKLLTECHVKGCKKGSVGCK